MAQKKCFGSCRIRYLWASRIRIRKILQCTPYSEYRGFHVFVKTKPVLLTNLPFCAMAVGHIQKLLENVRYRIILQVKLIHASYTNLEDFFYPLLLKSVIRSKMNWRIVLVVGTILSVYVSWFAFLLNVLLHSVSTAVSWIQIRMYLHWFACLLSGSVFGMWIWIRIEKHWNLLKLTDKPGFLPFKKAFVPS